jgi:hypothetical protein
MNTLNHAQYYFKSKTETKLYILIFFVRALNTIKWLKCTKGYIGQRFSFSGLIGKFEK